MQRAQIANRPIPGTSTPSSLFPLVLCRILWQSSIGVGEGRGCGLCAGAAAWPTQQWQQSLSLLDISALCCALSAGEMNRKQPHTDTDRHTQTDKVQNTHIETEPHGALQEACGHFAPGYVCLSVPLSLSIFRSSLLLFFPSPIPPPPAWRVCRVCFVLHICLDLLFLFSGRTKLKFSMQICSRVALEISVNTPAHPLPLHAIPHTSHCPPLCSFLSSLPCPSATAFLRGLQPILGNPHTELTLRLKHFAPFAISPSPALFHCYSLSFYLYFSCNSRNVTKLQHKTHLHIEYLLNIKRNSQIIKIPLVDI